MTWRKPFTFLVPTTALLATTFLAPSPASANEHNRISVNDHNVFTTSDICDFPLHSRSHVRGTVTEFYAANGDLIKVLGHFFETDTFAAHGESLRSATYHYNIRLTFDENGDLEDNVTNGVLVKVPLPGGGTFMSAGRLNISPDFTGNFLYLVDSGVVKNRDAFCDALSG
jgi:hypothetical protein